ncbi:MAG: PAS domain-containing protein [Acinetobacter sp.]|nr:PAS domain-containing protein [Acinetobacter sp.]
MSWFYVKVVMPLTDNHKLTKIVIKELLPNGGDSINDRIKQIGLQINAIRLDQECDFYLSNIPSFKSDKEGSLIDANPSFCHALGASKSQVLGLGWLNYIHPDDRERCRREWEDAVEYGTEIQSTFRCIDPETRKGFTYRYTALVLRDQNGVPVNITGKLGLLNP